MGYEAAVRQASVVPALVSHRRSFRDARAADGGYARPPNFRRSAALRNRRIQGVRMLASVGVAVVGFATAAVCASGSDSVASGTVASGRWDGHAWHLEAVQVSGRNCYRISVDFPFTRYAPPYSPNCAFGSHGAWNALTACPLAFVYGIADANATSLKITLQDGRTFRAAPFVKGGVNYFVRRISCGSRVVTIDPLGG